MIRTEIVFAALFIGLVMGFCVGYVRGWYVGKDWGIKIGKEEQRAEQHRKDVLERCS